MEVCGVWPSRTGAKGENTYGGPIWIVGRNVALTAEPEDALLEDKLRVACTHVGSNWIACLGAVGTDRRGEGAMTTLREEELEKHGVAVQGSKVVAGSMQRYGYGRACGEGRLGHLWSQTDLAFTYHKPSQIKILLRAWVPKYDEIVLKTQSHVISISRCLLESRFPT